MKLKKPSDNNQETTMAAKTDFRKRCIFVGFLFAAFIVAVVAWATLHAEKEAKKNQEIEKLEAAKQEYNDTVNVYNDMAGRYNAFLREMNDCNLLNSLTPVSLASTWNSNFENDPSLDKIVASTRNLREQADEMLAGLEGIAVTAYNEAVDNYNIMAVAYNELVPCTSIDFIKNLPGQYNIKEKVSDYKDIQESEDIEEVVSIIKKIVSSTDVVIANYLLIDQITNPDEEWVTERLKTVSSITGTQAVTQQKDPNGLLGGDGGYTACIYFTVKDIDAKIVPGTDIVDKGTDAGGAIEVYDTKEHALARCDYLSQFDGTLLYSGSYAVIGTMVIRTSYRLDNMTQCELTNQIAEVFTTVAVNG